MVNNDGPLGFPASFMTYGARGDSIPIGLLNNLIGLDIAAIKRKGQRDNNSHAL